MPAAPAAVAYYQATRTADAGDDEDSKRSQREAVRAYAKAAHLEMVNEFCDFGARGELPIGQRSGFVALLDFCLERHIRIVLVESASRITEGLVGQLAGWEWLQAGGIELVPVNDPTYLADMDLVDKAMNRILVAATQCQKASLVAKLRHTRDEIRETTGRCEGRKPVPPEVVARSTGWRGATPRPA